MYFLLPCNSIANALANAACERCKSGFVPTEKIVNSNGELYHEQCFVCAQCFQQFPEGLFYEVMLSDVPFIYHHTPLHKITSQQDVGLLLSISIENVMSNYLQEACLKLSSSLTVWRKEILWTWFPDALCSLLSPVWWVLQTLNIHCHSISILKDLRSPSFENANTAKTLTTILCNSFSKQLYRVICKRN